MAKLKLFILALLFAQHSLAQRSFITKWQTKSASESITIPTAGLRYNFRINWGDGSNWEQIKGYNPDPTHTYTNAGVHTVKISGTFPRIIFSYAEKENAKKLVSIEQWGDIAWKSMGSAFLYAENMESNATDEPLLSRVTDMSSMFLYASSFDGDLSGWDVSGVTDMSSMFKGASSFDGDISSWDVSNVRNFRDFLDESGFSSHHYTQLLINWSKLNLQSNLTFNAGDINCLTHAQASRQSIIDDYTWIIHDGDFVSSSLSTDVNISKPPKYIFENVDRITSTPAEYRLHRYALIIGNEKYKHFGNPAYATNDSRVFKKYCEKLLGIAPDNIFYLENGTSLGIKNELYKILEILRALDNKGELYFYYAGHLEIDSKGNKCLVYLPIHATTTLNMK